MSARPDLPRFSHNQEVYHLTDDVPGRIRALVQYIDCLRYQVIWQGRIIEEHAAEELTTEKPLLTGSSADRADD